MKQKFNHFLWVFIPGFLFPVLLFLVTWGSIYKGEFTFWDSVVRMYGTHLMQQYILFCMLPNLLYIFFAYKTDRWKTASGVIVALVPYLSLLFMNI